MMLVEMLSEAGAPPGIVNVIHGTHDAVNFICDHPDIKAISFVGSDVAVYFPTLFLFLILTLKSVYRIDFELIALDNNLQYNFQQDFVLLIGKTRV